MVKLSVIRYTKFNSMGQFITRKQIRLVRGHKFKRLNSDGRILLCVIWCFVIPWGSPVIPTGSTISSTTFDTRSVVDQYFSNKSDKQYKISDFFQFLIILISFLGLSGTLQEPHEGPILHFNVDPCSPSEHLSNETTPKFLDQSVQML